MNAFLKKSLHEPLVHFLLLGALLFAGWYWLQPSGLQEDDPASRDIRLSLDEITGIAMLFQSQWQREPTPAELADLVEDRIKEEILYREALAMGLEKDDTIIRRRLAQKMEFLAEDVAAAREPTTDELRAWYAQNTAQLTLPARYSFRHLYFSPDVRGVAARDDASRALEALKDAPQAAQQADTLADPFMYQDYYRERTPDFLGKEFGPAFAQTVDTLRPGSWQGPIESGYGWHLVYVDTVIPARVPAFEEIQSDLKGRWLAEQKTLAMGKAYDELRAKYTVYLPAPPETATPEVAATDTAAGAGLPAAPAANATAIAPAAETMTTTPEQSPL